MELALAALVTPDDLVVANAGDSGALLVSLDANGGVEWKWLSDFHNGMNPKDRARIRAEHPEESLRDLFDIIPANRPKKSPIEGSGIDRGSYWWQEEVAYFKDVLQPTKGLGDFYLKRAEFKPYYVKAMDRLGLTVRAYNPPYMSADPDVTTTSRNEDQVALILASDGLFDFLSPASIAYQVKIGFTSRTPQEMAMDLAKLAIDQCPCDISTDDITVVVIYLRKNEIMEHNSA
jgi:serine/threonine protein phosphatase PrpC